MILVQALERGHGHLPAGTLHLDIRSISFAGMSFAYLPHSPTLMSVLSTDLANPVEVTPPPPSYPDAGWSPWSEWTSCIDQVRIACDPHRARSRSRECRSGWGQGHRLPSVEPCVTGQGGREFEVRECRCEPPPDVMMGDGPAISAPIAPAGPCGRCHVHEICLLTGGVARCVWPRAMGPCGGWCEAQHEVCKALGNGTFQCIDDSGELSFVPLQPVRTSDRPTSAAECLPEEWRCGNGLCIPLARRCDGHANCYDMTDEFDCPCTNGFHCGNGTSCLEPHQRCNGVPECWDGSDEANCTTAITFSNTSMSLATEGIVVQDASRIVSSPVTRDNAWNVSCSAMVSRTVPIIVMSPRAARGRACQPSGGVATGDVPRPRCGATARMTAGMGAMRRTAPPASPC
ncbi:hypothetical protein LAZ67_1000378, partial [Cordylochernes scorpioides]